MDRLRIVQITDLHILADENADLSGVNPIQSLNHVVENINSLSPQAELVIASGDLTDEGSPAAYHLLRKTLHELTCPVYVMAGNHDETEVMRSELPGDNVFCQRQVDVGNWRLLLVNSKLPGSSCGFISDDEFAWLDKCLNSDIDRPVVLAMHHTPLKLCATHSCQVENTDDFLAKVKNYKQVKGLLAGHTHNAVEQTFDQLTVMTTPSTMVQVTHNQTDAMPNHGQFWDYHRADNSKHGYRVVDLYADGKLETDVQWVAAQ